MLRDKVRQQLTHQQLAGGPFRREFRRLFRGPCSSYTSAAERQQQPGHVVLVEALHEPVTVTAIFHVFRVQAQCQHFCCY
jgi:hypothetical protein